MAWLMDVLSRLHGQAWRNPVLFALVWVPILTMLILSFNPALTSAMALPSRIAFWAIHVALLLPLLLVAQAIIDHAFATRHVHPGVLVGAAALSVALLFAPVSMVLDLLFSPTPDLGPDPSAARLVLDELVSLAMPTLCVWLLVNGARLQMLSVPLMNPAVRDAGADQAASTHIGDDRGKADEAGPPSEIALAFWSKVPRSLGQDLISLSAEQHYLHVTTTKGRSLILFPIGRAVEAVARLGGLRIHRSHWAALRHITDVEKLGGTDLVVLSNGERLPVSRGNRRKLKDALDMARASAILRPTPRLENNVRSAAK